LRGVIWYQGEANTWRAYAYRTLFPLLIQTWRARWGQGDFAFYWVQLANYRQPLKDPAATSWAELREAQNATLALSNTAQALAIDLADADKPDDIHPKNKLEVGRRLALLARKNLFGENTLVASGPTYHSHEIQGGAMVISFDPNDEGGLTTKNGGRDVTGFAMAGADRKWRWATATLDTSGTVTVSAPMVPEPVAVRYGFEDNPAINLYNRSGLPAAPFRTDDWGWLTQQ
jgi:sialate O-acetylesterase